MSFWWLMVFWPAMCPLIQKFGKTRVSWRAAERGDWISGVAMAKAGVAPELPRTRDR